MSEENNIEKSKDKNTVKVDVPNNLLLLLMVFIIGAILIFLARSPLINKLSEPGFARGVITFIICISTIALAFIMVYQAFQGQSDDTKFRRAREIFTGLMGVLGTIVGFYFGSAVLDADAPKVANLQISDKEIVSYVSGGTMPYRVEIILKGKYADSSNFDIKNNIITEDGWVRYIFANPVVEASVELLVKDSKNIAASNKGQFKKTENIQESETDMTGIENKTKPEVEETAETKTEPVSQGH
ncbi:MAG: hypothetical protein JW927_20150 [Deltaproteobacteria bacterium]|nr:hypothetical protein [Deltaproteobacteria bacterium]